MDKDKTVDARLERIEERLVKVEEQLAHLELFFDRELKELNGCLEETRAAKRKADMLWQMMQQMPAVCDIKEETPPPHY